MRYRAAIVGAGRIGALLDEPNSPNVLTHAHGFTDHGGFEVVGFVDCDPKQAHEAAVRWGGEVFENLDDLFRREKVDVISVCVPDELHYQTLLALAELPVRLVFVEKPVVRSAAEAEEIERVYRRWPDRVLVNYSRRFLPEIRQIKERINKGEFGALITGTGYYGKGLVHNGSHLIDLLRYFAGEIDQAHKISELEDFRVDDPSVSAVLTMGNGGVFFLRNIDSRKFDVFELDLTFERYRVRIYELGTLMEEYSVGNNEVFHGYRTLNRMTQYATDYRNAMQHAITNIHDHLANQGKLLCTLQESVQTVSTCVKIAGVGV